MRTDLEALYALLLQHMIPGKQTTRDLAQTTSVTTALGTSLTVMQHGDELNVGAAIVEADRIEASDGVIYVVNRMLVPPGNIKPVAKLCT